MLKQALEMSMQPSASDDELTSAPSVVTRDFSMMSEEEQMAYAMQMSMDPGLSISTLSRSRFPIHNFTVLAKKKLTFFRTHY